MPDLFSSEVCISLGHEMWSNNFKHSIFFFNGIESNAVKMYTSGQSLQNAWQISGSSLESPSEFRTAKPRDKSDLDHEELPYEIQKVLAVNLSALDMISESSCTALHSHMRFK